MEEIKTSITVQERAITLSVIGLFGVVLSFAIGPKLIPISILTCFVYYLMTGDRPTFLYAQAVTFRRDLA